VKRFDCLSVECPLFGPHLLEASAGTGKTFAIEHVFVRLVLSNIPIEKILTVTFTRASTRELKQRILSNLEKALLCLRGQLDLPSWRYLEPFRGSQEAIFLLISALQGFDLCQIFTIHGFCFRVLKEFGFESGHFSLDDPDCPLEIAKKLRLALQEFCEHPLDIDILCPEQLRLVFGKYENLYVLGSFLLKAKGDEVSPFSFKKWREEFQNRLSCCPYSIKEDLLREDFDRIRVGYKSYKGDFEEQVGLLAKALENREDPLFFRKLLLHEGSLFLFLDPSQRKVKAQEIKDLNYPDFFNWALREIGPIVLEASNRKHVLSVLVSAWKRFEKTSVSLDGVFRPDDILSEMTVAMKNPAFLSKLQDRFQAVIIDEFQDTDPVQWNIFETAFLQSPHLKALYLVGDPKQSIYRFRNADVYTYFLAKEMLGSSHLYHLDTNFRSSKGMIDSLNVLFSRNWLSLPQKNSSILYQPVISGSSISSDLQDEKKAIHWIIGVGKASYEETFLPYCVLEIERYPPSTKIAILVKDRYEMEKAKKLLRERNIACVARSHESLADTFMFKCLRELFDAVGSPSEENKRRILEYGPFRLSGSLNYWHELILEKGLSFFFAQVLEDVSDPDLYQILEELFAWEQREGFSFEGLKRFLNEFEKLDPEEGSRRRMDEVEDAVQILTLHVSKGLEFDIVFALALGSSSPTDEEEEAELNAEKLRQLYVAMTRAKKRLYVPLKKQASLKQLSPMDLFIRQIEKEEGAFIPYLEKLSQTYDLSFEEVDRVVLNPKPDIRKEEQFIQVKQSKIEYSPSYIHSFTSLKKRHGSPVTIDEKDPLDLPGGKETGTLIHAIFENLFELGEAVWKNEEEINRLIENQLSNTPLAVHIDLVQAMVRETLSRTFSDGDVVFSFKDLKADEIFVEMEFLYAKGAHFVKGFIDCVFIYGGKWYIIDWKTNRLSNSSPEAIEEIMEANEYELQASLYAEALKTFFGSLPFGGCFYLFLREGCYVHFFPHSSKRQYG
jgi:exodeoxyribonuclease V beta subunit